jgi:hypothetical protein
MKNYIYTVVICLQVISIILMIFFGIVFLAANGSGHNIPRSTNIFFVTLFTASLVAYCLLSVWKESIKEK